MLCKRKVVSRMKIPKKVIIKGAEYKVMIVKQIDDDDSEGECDSNVKTIKIRKSLSKEQRELTFVHECFHAVLAEIHMQLPDDLEEACVDALSQYAFDVLIKK